MKKISMVLIGTLGVACSSGAGIPGAASEVRRPEADENGVRVAGGETSDFGSGTSEPNDCRSLETTTLGVAEALALRLPIEHIVSILDEPFEAPFHWGYRCDGDAEGGSAAPALLSLNAELVNVYRTTRTSLPDAPPGTVCEDRLEYRAVIELSTSDDRISGRFYARFDPIFTYRDTIVVRASADARNFTGSLTFPVDLERPHFSAIIANLTLREEGSFGSIDVEVNYTDEEPALFPERHGSGGFWPADARWDDGISVLPAGDGSYTQPTFVVRDLPLCRDSAPAAAGASAVSLDTYPGSNEPPTCVVRASFFGQGEYGGVTAPEYVPPPSDAVIYGAPDESLDITLLIDGVDMAADRRGGIPRSLGRLPVGTHIVMETRSTDAAFMPFAGLTIDGFGSTGYDQFDFCQPLGCVARVEDTVAGYCSE